MTSHRASPRVVLVAIVLTGACLRVWGLGFGLPLALARPDETTVAGSAVQFLTGNLAPVSFAYPTFFMYALALVYVSYYWLTQPLTHFATLAAFAESRRQSLAPFFYLSRGVSAIMGTLTVWWVYRLARRTMDESVGVVAALYLALSFLHVRDSHFGVTDVTLTGFVVLSVLAIVRWQETGGVGRAAAAGFAAGLTTSVKYNGLGLWVPFLVAITLRAVDAREARTAELRRAALAVAVFAVVFVVGFIGTSPYILLEWDRFRADVLAQGQIFAIGHGLVLTRGWLQHAIVTLPAAIGWPICLAGVVGTALLLATRLRQSAVLLAFPLAYYYVAGSGHTVFARYMLPVLPFLSISAAWLTVTAVRLVVPERRRTWRTGLTMAVALALVAPTAWKAVAMDRLLARTDSRIVVARALIRQIPAGSTLYHSGDVWGRIPLEIDGRQLDVHLWDYDERTNQFAPEGATLPDWIVLQRSPLVLYSQVPAGVERIAREQYELVYSLRAFDDRPGRIYDQQDAFFLPLDGLEGVTRPGPNFEVYRRKGR